MTDIQQKMRDAAVQRDTERQAEFSRIADIVLGANRDRRRVEEVIALDGGHVVAVNDRQNTTWTSVHQDKRSTRYFHTQHEAILHLIARVNGADQHDDTPVIYAGRILGMKEQ